MQRSPILEMRGISKAFPGVQALSEVSFQVRTGEVHALVGENGAGKSTLMKILSGLQEPDTGELVFKDQSVRFQQPFEAIAHGIGAIHQELTVIPHLSVAENIFLGHLPTNRLGFVNRRRLLNDARTILDSLGLPLEPRTKVGALPVGIQQMVEIAKALSHDAEFIIMDEPTSSLSQRETEMLWTTIKRLRDQGRAIVFISHKLDEIFALADRVTVLRDGRWVATEPAARLTPERLVTLMVGRDLQSAAGEHPRNVGPAVLQVQGLTRQGFFTAIDFTLHAGEIVGFAGLVGAGRSDLARSLFGADPVDAGTIRLDGRRLSLSSPREAIRAGIALVPEDRKEQALILAMNVSENIVLPQTENLTRHGVLNGSRERKLAEDFVERLDIRAASLDQAVLNLSGGNQQKVALARWLALKPRVLIVDEPTRGIDVGAKAEIYALLRRLAGEGLAIMLISSDMAEILTVSDRILVMRAGRLVAEFTAAPDEEAIASYAIGASGVSAS